MKRFITIDVLNGSEMYDDSLPVLTFPESSVDKTHFIPQVDLTKVVGNITDSEKSKYYDFPDGKDTGASVPLARRKGADLAELIVEGRKLQEEFISDYNDAKAKKAHKEAVDKILNNSSVSSPAPSGSASAE
ncbi:hypothetical protein [Capybara microvirus Cap1_SP_95]|nr:hypothetical protein [Capybara microvirus Cap1_SP_95]